PTLAVIQHFEIGQLDCREAIYRLSAAIRYYLRTEEAQKPYYWADGCFDEAERLAVVMRRYHPEWLAGDLASNLEANHR
uniref:hypothetical protein n=1 Tax=Klebsiella pneumoniae TaxID=573 RepID=UPI0013D376F3